MRLQRTTVFCMQRLRLNNRLCSSQPQILDQVVAKTFEECDHNQDDFIDLKEFAST